MSKILLWMTARVARKFCYFDNKNGWFYYDVLSAWYDSPCVIANTLSFYD